VIPINQFKGHDYQLISGNKLDILFTSKTFPVFSSPVINFFDAISRQCLPLCKREDLRPFSAFFFYIRSKNLKKLFQESSYSHSSVGLGLSLNISPSNVPLNSLYSLLFTLLSGSPCVLRISQITISALGEFFPIIDSIYTNYRDSIPAYSIISYPRSSPLTSLISELCSSRVVWGGDSTATQIRKLPCPPGCKDIFFPNRQSCAIVNLKALCSAQYPDDILSRFAKDIAMFSQQACSSPLHIFFVDSSRDDIHSIYKFFESLDRSISSLETKFYSPKECLESALSLNLAFTSLTPLYSGRYLRTCYTNTSDTHDVLAPNRKHGNLTFSLEGSIDNLKFNYHYQTIVFLPYPDHQSRQIFFDKYYHSFDRLVRPGQAIDMHLHWDGHDIIRTISRQVFF